MPIYMDRHDFSGITAKDVAAAHQEDLKIQEKFGCRGFTYWFDEERQMAFCLIEAPDQEAVKNMHDQAHGLVPHEIIEVESHTVKAFLGRIEHPQSSENSLHSDLVVFDDPAFRTIMVSELKDADFLPSKIGQAETRELLSFHHGVIREAFEQYEGKEVQHSGHYFLASFISASKAILCASQIQKKFRVHNRKTSAFNLDVQKGLRACLNFDL